MAIAQCEPQHILPPPADTTGRFGHRVQVNDRHLIVGDYQGDSDCGGFLCTTGVVYAYERDAPTGEWTLSQTIVPHDIRQGDGFGKEAHLNGNRMIVGATSADLGGVGTGGAYIYEHEGAQWNEIARLASPAPHFVGQFGRTVFIDDDVALVMQYTQQVFVFEVDSGEWMHTQTLSPDDGGGPFGDAIAMDDHWLFLAAPLDDAAYPSAGSVYIYERDGVAGFTFHSKLLPPADVHAWPFGNKVEWDGDTLAVAGYLSHRTVEGQGVVYIYDYADGQFAFQQELVQDHPLTRGEYFGGSLALDGNRILVGANGVDTPKSGGAAFVFERGGDGVWRQVARLLPTGFTSDLGAHVDLSGDTAVVGASSEGVAGLRRGAAHVFDLSCLTCAADLNLFQDGDATADFDGDATADFDGDGELTIFDFLAFQTAFDAGCQ
jgi:hypothetical protein